MEFVKNFWQIIFPDKCLGCRSRGSLLCVRCKSRFSPAEAPEHDWIISIFSYRDPVMRNVVRTLKYKNGRRLARNFGRNLSDALLEFLAEEKLFLPESGITLVPIPLSKKRMKARGYNQSEILAREIIKNSADNIKIENNLLKKVLDTKPQAEIRNKSERLKNLGECFAVAHTKISKPTTIFLIDDVTTTGATLLSARRTLLSNGYKKVFALTLCH